MIDEIELDLKHSAAIGNRRSGQPAGIDVESRVPPMVQLRTERHADLTDDLRPHMQGLVSVEPGIEWQSGPGSRVSLAGGIERHIFKMVSLFTFLKQKSDILLTS